MQVRYFHFAKESGGQKMCNRQMQINKESLKYYQEREVKEGQERGLVLKRRIV